MPTIDQYFPPQPNPNPNHKKRKATSPSSSPTTATKDKLTSLSNLLDAHVSAHPGAADATLIIIIRVLMELITEVINANHQHTQPPAALNLSSTTIAEDTEDMDTDNQPPHTPTPAQSPKAKISQITEEDVKEWIELKDRSRSLVMENVPEITDTANNRQRRDESIVMEMLDSLDVQGRPIAVWRMGRPGRSGHPRPVKIVLPCSSMQQEVLAKLPNLWRRNANFRHVYVRPSISQAQRHQEYLLRQEKRQLEKETGRRYTIREGRVVPAELRQSFLRGSGGARAFPMTRPPHNTPSNSLAASPASSFRSMASATSHQSN